MPRGIRICIIIALAASLLSAATIALTSVVVRKPLKVSISVLDPTLTLTAVDLESYYNVTTHRYTKCKITVTNTATGGVNANVTITLRDAGNIIIAYGQITINTPESSVSVEVPLIWSAGKTVSDFKGGEIVIHQRS